MAAIAYILVGLLLCLLGKVCALLGPRTFKSTEPEFRGGKHTFPRRGTKTVLVSQGPPTPSK